MPDANTSQRLQIFRPGQHTAMSGARFAFGEADLQATVNAYDPALHEAPIVVGHPAHDLPAYGWVKGLAYADGAIDAEPYQVDPAFAELVAAGRYKKISAAFYEPTAPNNPVPGVYYLRHVGFLGAQPPAVKGLRAPQFADGEPGVVTFSEWDDRTHASLWRGLREWLIGKFGQEEADKVVPAYNVADLERSAERAIEAALAVPGQPAPNPAFATPTHSQEVTVTEAEAAQLRQQNEELARQNAQLLATQREAQIAASHAGNVAFADRLVAEARVLPAWRDVVVATLDHFAAQPAPVEFGEGEARAPVADKLRELLAAIPPAVAFGEHATRTAAADPDAQAAQADAPPEGVRVDFGEGADPNRLAQHEKVLAHMKAHGVDYATAARAVIA